MGNFFIVRVEIESHVVEPLEVIDILNLLLDK
jgi:hypothetical protein